MITVPTAMNCQNGSTLMKTRPYWITAITSAPAMVPQMVPEPPNRLAPSDSSSAMNGFGISRPATMTTSIDIPAVAITDRTASITNTRGAPRTSPAVPMLGMTTLTIAAVGVGRIATSARQHPTGNPPGEPVHTPAERRAFGGDHSMTQRVTFDLELHDTVGELIASLPQCGDLGVAAGNGRADLDEFGLEPDGSIPLGPPGDTGFGCFARRSPGRIVPGDGGGPGICIGRPGGAIRCERHNRFRSSSWTALTRAVRSSVATATAARTLSNSSS